MGRATIAIFARKKGPLRSLLFALILAIVFYYGYYHLSSFLSSRAVLTTGAAIVLDAGHGGVDPGTHYGELKEKDIVLDVVLRMRDYLEGQGLRVDLTRDSDVDLGGELKAGTKGLEARLQLIKGTTGGKYSLQQFHGQKQKGAVVLSKRLSGGKSWLKRFCKKWVNSNF